MRQARPGSDGAACGGARAAPRAAGWRTLHPRAHFVDAVTTFNRFSTLESGRHVYKVNESG